ncbi:hypothetical protein [Vibrio chagasii]|uniref:hypothetical protein n=1 Tax=Vibrio chagasii TaxID=170679 RepID=UPI00338A5163|nr:Glycosyltransferase [Vibrio chagasii]
MIDILVIPYRDIYFWDRYGPAVRDLQIIEELSQLEVIKNISVLNRPVSIYERFFNKNKRKFDYIKGVDIFDSTSFELFGPLKKRAWTVSCYDAFIRECVSTCLSKSNNKLVVLDFTPFAILPISDNERVFYWHDMIDNFTKHNCFSEYEKNLVSNKYRYVADHYSYMTSVSNVAANEVLKYKELNYSVLPNGLFYGEKNNQPSVCSEESYHFGFVGFVTDKFDIDFVSYLAKKFDVVVYGEVYDDSVKNKLLSCGVSVKGAFSYQELPKLIATFKVGLLPYLSEKSHDGSPLKLYEYLKYNKPCLTSINYEYSNEFIVNYNESLNVGEDIERLFEVTGKECISERLPESIKLSDYVKKSLLSSGFLGV